MPYIIPYFGFRKTEFRRQLFCIFPHSSRRNRRRAKLLVDSKPPRHVHAGEIAASATRQHCTFPLCNATISD
ncbi:MAG: hypothetical protein H7Z39_11905 [Burkholderiaceae bacterium]|nr:hypothetical protein [Burkholderiaceae bacterium]